MTDHLLSTTLLDTTPLLVLRPPDTSRMPRFLILTLMLASLGCAKAGDKNPGARQTRGRDKSNLSKKLSSLNSAHQGLLVADLDQFRPGRPKGDILTDVNWRGHFYMAAEHRGKTVCATIYELSPAGPNDKGGVWVWAIFVDDTFVKFVKEPATLPGDMETVDHRGTPWSRPKAFKAGDTRFLIRAVDGNAVTSADLKKEVESLPAPREQHVDPGLAAAYLLLRAIGAAPGPDPLATEKDYLRNAELRDQFNAARLKIGMTQPEVETVLKARPLESGKVEAGPYSIYGSNESFNIDTWLHFSNILVIFREEKTIVISSISAGYDWRGRLGEATTDLPKRAAAKPSHDNRAAR